MLNMKQIQAEARKYGMVSGWDAKRAIIRNIYAKSEDRKTDLRYFAECVGQTFEYVAIQGQIYQYSVEKKTKKYNKPYNKEKIKNKVEEKLKETKKILILDQLQGEAVGGGSVEKLAAEIFIEETKAPSYIREQQAWKSIRDQKGIGFVEAAAIAAGVLLLLAAVVSNPTVALAAVAGIQSHRI